MHIVFLTHTFPVKNLLYTTGAGNYIANMSKALVKFGHRVTVVVEAENEEIFESEGIHIRKIRATRGFSNTGRPMSVLMKLIKNISRSIWYNLEVARIHRYNPIDVVQCVNTYGIGLFRNKKIPYVIRISDYPSLWSGANKESYDFNECIKTRRLDEEVQFIALKRADILVAPSYLMKKLVEGRINKAVQVVEGPTIIEYTESNTYKKYDLTESEYLVTYGAMIFRKEILVLAKIIDDILDEFPKIKYVMIGKDREVFYQGKYMLASEMFYSNIVRNRERFLFLGEISDRKCLFKIIKNAYACILPTRIDNLPNTCMESMALGKVVVSTNKTSVEQLITNGYNGFLSNIGDEKEYYNKIKYVLEMEDNYKRQVEQRAVERITDLAPELVYNQMIEIYNEAIQIHEQS